MKHFKAKSLIVLLTLAFITAIFASCNIAPISLKLAELKAGDVVLTETDGKYVHTVDYETDSLTISATPKEETATVEGLGEKTLTVGKNEFIVKVSKGGKSSEYTVEITRNPAVLDLAELKIGETVLTADGDGTYAYSVENTVKKVNLTAKAVKDYATVEGVGEKDLAIGENAFTVKVSAGSDEKTYTVKVTRAAADLSLKEVKIGETVLTADGDGVYKTQIANTVTEITLDVSATNSIATIEGAGLKQGLVVGENRFEIKVVVGEESKTYTVIVTRAKSDVNTIQSIVVNDKAASFVEEDGAYAITVDTATVTVNVTLTSDVSTYEIEPAVGTLKEGNNEFEIIVTAENGATANYTLKINLVLPVYNVTYAGNVEGAITNEGFTYKHGKEQSINITLDEKYTQSYANLVVTYKVGDGEEIPVDLDENYGFVIPSDKATGDVTVTVSGIAINVYTITYHKDGATTTETVNHGANAVQNAITPNTETQEVLDGYTYSHYERWETATGMVPSLDNVTANVEVYFKSDVLVAHDFAYYAPMGGAITYYTANQMNEYVLGDENGDVTFKVLVKSLATDGSSALEGKTSFVVYGTAIWSQANEVGVGVLESELNKWFTVTASAADKKITVYNPEGKIVSEKTVEAYAANTISIAMHADITVAAVNPTMPTLHTVTYLDEKGEQLHTQKVIEGKAANYEYAPEDVDLGNGYTRTYTGKWIAANGEAVDLSCVNGDITVKPESLAIKHYEPNQCPDYTPVIKTNKYINPAIEVLRFKVRVLSSTNAEYPTITVYPSTGWNDNLNATETARLYVGDIFGKWCTVEINSLEKSVSIYNPDGTLADKKNITNFAIGEITFFMQNHSFDIAVEVDEKECYDADKTTKLATTLVQRGSNNVIYTYSSETDDEGYVKTIDTWLPIEGSDNKVYAAKVGYTRKQTIVGSDVKLLATNKHASVDNDGMIIFKIRMTATDWTGLNIVLADGDYVGVSGGLMNYTEWLTVTINSANGEIEIKKADGTLQNLDTANHQTVQVNINNVAINVSGVAYEVFVIV